MTSENGTEAVAASLAAAANRASEAIQAALEGLDAIADALPPGNPCDRHPGEHMTAATASAQVWGQIAVALAVRELTAHIAAIGKLAETRTVPRAQAVARPWLYGPDVPSATVPASVVPCAAPHPTEPDVSCGALVHAADVQHQSLGGLAWGAGKPATPVAERGGQARRRASRDAGRHSAYLDAGDEVGGPWDDSADQRAADSADDPDTDGTPGSNL